jgi:hypothetical protein
MFGNGVKEDERLVTVVGEVARRFVSVILATGSVVVVDPGRVVFLNFIGIIEPVRTECESVCEKGGKDGINGGHELTLAR